MWAVLQTLNVSVQGRICSLITAIRWVIAFKAISINKSYSGCCMQQQPLIYIQLQPWLHECCSIILEPLPWVHPCCHVSRSLSILKRPRRRSTACVCCNDRARAPSHLTEQNQHHQCRCWRQSRGRACENPPGNKKNAPAARDLGAVVTAGEGAVFPCKSVTPIRGPGE